jgi:hypothetical protein
VLLPVANADPALRHTETIRVPTRLLRRAVDGQVEVSWDVESLEPADIDAGCNMILGHQVQYVLVAPGAEPIDAGMDLGGDVDFSGAQGSSTLSVQPPASSSPGPWTLRAVLQVFETDIPPQHMWSPQSGRFRVLLDRTIEAPIDFPPPAAPG